VRPGIERGTRKGVDRVTGFAIAPVRSLCELPVVFVGMAVDALTCRDGFAEVRTLVTRRAVHGRMLSRQRIAGPRVIKSLE